MKLDIYDLFRRDDLQQAEKKKEEEKLKEGVLRAGNAGAVTGDGQFVGQCPRKAGLRLAGVNLEVSEDRYVMFEFGIQNEAIVIEKLKRQLKDTVVITGDDVNSISWKLPSGREVSGRPDVLISSKEGKPLLVLELKMVASVWTARDVVFGNSPKLAHIIQATHYASRLGCPCKLVYIQPVDFQTPMWGSTIDMFPKPGEPLSELIEYTEKDITEGKGKLATKKRVFMPKKVLPSRTVYDIEAGPDGKIRYRVEGSKGKWTTTPISMKGIEKFYEWVDTSDDLGPRPVALKSNGDFENYTLCDYCELKDHCDRYESNSGKWLSEVSRAVESGTLKKN